MGSTRTVVFVCQHGAAKSILAAAVLERLAAEQGAPLRALARGTEPEPRVAPAVAEGFEVAESTIAERLRELVNDIARSGPAITPPRAT